MATAKIVIKTRKSKTEIDRAFQLGDDEKGFLDFMATVSRNQASKLIADSSDPEFIGRFKKHPNKHISTYAQHKLEKLSVANG